MRGKKAKEIRKSIGTYVGAKQYRTFPDGSVRLVRGFRKEYQIRKKLYLKGVRV